MFDLDTIKQLPPEEAIVSLNKWIEENPENDTLHVVRGQKLWLLNRRGEAINDYLMAIKINPDSKAKTLLEYSRSILNYYNKDLLNP